MTSAPYFQTQPTGTGYSLSKASHVQPRELKDEVTPTTDAEEKVDTFEASTTEEPSETTEAEEAPKKLNKYQRKKLDDMMKKRATLICSIGAVGGLIDKDPRTKLKDLYKNPIVSFITGGIVGTGLMGIFALGIKYANGQHNNFIPKFSPWDLILVPFALFGAIGSVFSANAYNKAVHYFIKKNGKDAKVEDVLKQISGLEGTKEELKLKD